MEKKRLIKKEKAILCYLEIFILLSSMFAFCVLMNLENVGAQSDMSSTGTAQTHSEIYALEKEKIDLDAQLTKKQIELATENAKIKNEGKIKNLEQEIKTLNDRIALNAKRIGELKKESKPDVLADTVNKIKDVQIYAQIIGQVTGRPEFSQAIAGAISVGYVAKALAEKLFKSAKVGNIAFALAFVWSLSQYRDYETETVIFSCLPWQAPRGGADCEKCNDAKEPCSQYRCESLGQACLFVEEGEMCINAGKGDTSAPKITPNEGALTSGHEYTDVKTTPSDKGYGMRIINPTGKNKCIKAFTQLQFGIKTDEPSKCRLDYQHTSNLDDMGFAFGGETFAYNHTEQLSLPSPDAINDQGNTSSPAIKNDGKYTLYVRCTDANGNGIDGAEFAVNFCVEEGPDTTPPRIEETSINNNNPVRFNQSEVYIELYLNEPAVCKWSRRDQKYDDMNNSFTCAENTWQMNSKLTYTCAGTLTGIRDRTENEFFFRCKDQPWADEANRNVNSESYKFTLVGTEPLNIVDVEPDNKTIIGPVNDVDVNIEVKTANGYQNGDSRCSYSGDGNSYIEFYETGGNIHKQTLTLQEGTYFYYIKCIDLGGNYDIGNTTFNVETDVSAPLIVRAYNEPGVGLKVVTNEKSTCVYSTNNCDFRIDDGINMPVANSKQHTTAWKLNQNYYIKCKDEFNNQPAPDTCSIIIRAYNQ